ncbi:ewing's tumor-associated antigen 1 [Cyclopterus lumpus]|uniref:ewing's tumor-associated antigen 1 n=1 Tax=Cyclopterus lumpus TaxID=8103 RepID=UPI001486A434|nr:ewing's tumor-associated antigen 1 [Cyclopterus lumpus]
MNRSRGTVEPPVGPTKPNRLRRSFRRTQTAAEVGSPKSQQPEFKTPTRIPRPRAGAGFSAESPNNDSDFQQDIIWDATSPSPNGPGKRGKKQKPPGVVDISDIVNRIAPKHGRPTVAEPTLQQWIGDSAAIPCTPDAQGPKPKKKSPRPNGVDDLLKLAKQFDFNMFRREEEEEVDDRRSPELLSEDVSDSENADRSDASFPASRRPAAKAPNGTDERFRMEDDLDFLFDGPTQRLSGSLSQPSQVKPASREAAGKPPAPSASHGATSGVSTSGVSTSGVSTAAKDEFEDDWENDDLLNDSLVLAMTQDPQSFAAPRHSSTQKPLGQVRPRRESPASVVQDNVRQRATFKLEPNLNFSFQRIQTNPKVDHGSKAAVKDAQRNRFSPTQRTSDAVKPVPQKPPVPQRASDATAWNTSARSFPTEPASAPSRGEATDLPDEDLSAFFSPDPVWDDPADDDLLCEMCEDVENQLQSAENVSAGRAPPGGRASQPRASPPPSSNRQPDDRQPFDPKKQTAASLACAAGRPAGGSWTGGSVAAGVRLTESFRYSQAKNTSGSTSGSTWTPGKDQFTFKKPNDPVPTATSNGKCSAAEIEQKKQLAMERRRRRLQDAQNLRAPT